MRSTPGFRGLASGAGLIAFSAFVLAIGCENRMTAPTTTGTSGSDSGSSSSGHLSPLTTIVQASTVEQVGAGQTGTSNNYLGQSVTIPGTSSYDSVRFNWDGFGDVPPTAPATRGPLAAGELFLLTQEYLGLPADLGPSTPGYVAQSQKIENGRYVFSPSVTLNAGTKYWVYAAWPPGSVGGFHPITGFSEDSYAGGDMYIAPELSGFNPQPFRKAPASWLLISPGPPPVYRIPPAGTYVDANFTLMGAPTAK